MEKMEISEQDLKECRELAQNCRDEAAKRLVGQNQVIDGILMAMVAGGHVLLEGVPGLAKTLAVRTFAEISGEEKDRLSHRGKALRLLAGRLAER